MYNLRRLVLLLFTLFSVTVIAARAQDVPADLAGILQWNIESAVRLEGGAGRVVFSRPAPDSLRSDSLYAYYGVSGKSTVWEAYVGGQRYVYTQAYGFHALDSEAQAFYATYTEHIARAGDSDRNGVPDNIDALRILALLKTMVSE